MRRGGPLRRQRQDDELDLRLGKGRGGAGLLPPKGVSNLIWLDRGYSALFGILVAWFRLAGGRLRYVGLPIVDELSELPDGGWSGRGLVFGWEFCRFHMVRNG